jgi:GDP-4-dehydro-6-deoxy-D-mannose reductase
MTNAVYITGVTGFSGSHMAEFILNDHPDIEVHAMCRPEGNMRYIREIKDRIELHKGDLTDFGSVFSPINAVRPRYIIHMASKTYVRYSFTNPWSFMDANCKGTLNVLETIRHIDQDISSYKPRVLLVSSAEIYGHVKPGETPISEENPLRPLSPYAVSKAVGDMLGYQYFKSWNMDVVRSRAFSIEGPRRGEIYAMSSFCKQVVEIERGMRDPVIYTGNLDSTRTYCDVRDIGRAYWSLMEKGRSGEAYNISGDHTTTIRDALNFILRTAGVHASIVIDKERLRPSDTTVQIPTSAKFRKETGWTPTIPFEKTIKDLLDDWRHRIEV